MSPQPKSAPSTATGKYSVAPVVMAVLSMLPPWLPGVPQFTGSPSGATPITPIMGLSGIDSLSLHLSSPSSMAHRRVLHASKRSPHTPSSLPVHEAVWASSSMSSIVTFSAPPGTAPSTYTGPVAGLMASQSISSSSSSGVLRADAHRVARRYPERRLEVAREREQHALVS